MLNKFVTIAVTIWNKYRKIGGLQIMTVSFLIAGGSALVAVLGSNIRESIDGTSLTYFLGSVILYTGWGVMHIAALSMFIGIVIHFVGMFSQDK